MGNLILESLEAFSQKFNQHDLIKYLQNDSVSLTRKIAWMRCASPFVMGFGDLPDYLSRDSTDPLQKAINQHMKEEVGHAAWFL